MATTSRHPDSALSLNEALTVSDPGLVRLILLVELFNRDLRFGHVGELKDEIDHLVLGDRSTKLSQRVGIVTIVIPDLVRSARHLARALDQRTADFVIGQRDL